MREVLGRLATVYADHGIRDGKAVWPQVAGTEGPVITQYFGASSTEAFYAHRAANMPGMEADFEDLVQELTELLRKSKNLGWATRRDLGYQPSNQARVTTNSRVDPRERMRRVETCQQQITYRP